MNACDAQGDCFLMIRGLGVLDPLPQIDHLELSPSRPTNVQTFWAGSRQ
jgi:hypothetical protein